MRLKTTRSNFPQDGKCYVELNRRFHQVIEENHPIPNSTSAVYRIEFVMPNGEIIRYDGQSKHLKCLNFRTKNWVKADCRPFTHYNDRVRTMLEKCVSATFYIKYVKDEEVNTIEKQRIWESLDAGYKIINVELYGYKSCK